MPAKSSTIDLVEVPAADEHWYVKLKNGKVVPYSKASVETRDSLPLYKSCTTITGIIPKDYGYYKWLGDMPSHDLAMNYMRHRGDIGTTVHNAMEHIFRHPKTSLDRKSYSDEEWDLFWSIFQAMKSLKMKRKGWVENVLHDDDDMTAGTADRYGPVGKEYWMIDYKTSKAIQLSHKIQVQKYGRMYQKMGFPVDKLCVIRGAPKCRIGYEMEVFDFKPEYDLAYEYALFFHKLLYPKAKPKMKEVPVSLSQGML